MRLWRSASLTSRLLAIFILTAIAATLLMTNLFSRGLGSQWQRAIVPHLYQYVAYIRDDLGSPPDQTRARELTARLPIQIQVHALANQAMVFTTRDQPLSVEDIKFFNPRRLNQRRMANLNRSETAPFDNIGISDDKRNPILRLDFDEHRVFVELSRPRGRKRDHDVLLFAIAGLALLLSLCYLAIRHLLKPIGHLQGTVHKISMGDLTARTHASGDDDLARLANSVDQMSVRIQQMLDAKRELLLAISHELRSPLTRARLATELLEPSRHQSKLISNIDEMDNLIASLVESERLQTHVVLDLQQVDVNQLIANAVNSFETAINWTSNGKPCPITADEARLYVLVRNLLDNAMQHGKPSAQSTAQVSIELDCSEAQVNIMVTDTGPGIDASHLNSVTEPFYRPDASRTRQTGGMGLGLYLCQRIAQAHGGTLTIESPKDEDVGVRAIVCLPRK